jgi:hypothetical protein
MNEVSESGMKADRKACGRSRVTNGTRRFGDGDGRSSIARRLKDLHAALAAPVAFDDLPESTQQLVRRAALLAYEAERMEGGATRGEPIDPVAHATIANALSRLLTRLERAKAATPVKEGPSLAEAMAMVPEGVVA